MTDGTDDPNTNSGFGTGDDATSDIPDGPDKPSADRFDTDELDADELDADELAVRDLLRRTPEDLDRDFAARAITAAIGVAGAEVTRPDFSADVSTSRTTSTGLRPAWRHHSGLLGTAAAVVAVLVVSVAAIMGLNQSGSSTGTADQALATAQADGAGAKQDAAESRVASEPSTDAESPGASTYSDEGASQKNSGDSAESTAESTDASGSNAEGSDLAFAGSFDDAADVLDVTAAPGGSDDADEIHEPTRGTFDVPPGAPAPPHNLTSCANSIQQQGYQPQSWVLIGDVAAITARAQPDSQSSEDRVVIYRVRTCTPWN